MRLLSLLWLVSLRKWWLKWFAWNLVDYAFKRAKICFWQFNRSSFKWVYTSLTPNCLLLRYPHSFFWFKEALIVLSLNKTVSLKSLRKTLLFLRIFVERPIWNRSFHFSLNVCVRLLRNISNYRASRTRSLSILNCFY